MWLGHRQEKPKSWLTEASFPVGCMQRISARGLPPLNTTQELHEKLSQRTTVNVETSLKMCSEHVRVSLQPTSFKH